MTEYPQQEGVSGNSRRATISKRDIVTIYADAAPGGASNPEYTLLLGEDILAEVLQVSGGEQIRGKQVEAGTSFVVSIAWIDGLSLNAKCAVTIGSGFYAGETLYTRRIHVETDRARPKAFQLHCSSRE